MVQLKVIIVNASPAEALKLEEVLLDTACLEKFYNIGLEQVLAQVPDWTNWDLIIARYLDGSSNKLLSVLAPILRKSFPPVFFLVDQYQPALVNKLLDFGGRRVLPLNDFELLIRTTIEGVFRDEISKEPDKSQNLWNRLVSPNRKSVSVLERLENRNEGIANLFAHGVIGICLIKNSDGRCIDCNDSFARILDWPREELLGRVPLELGLPGDLISQALSSNESHPQAAVIERQVLTRGGQSRTVQVHIDWVKWHGQECALVLMQDITEKERDKEKIKRLNAELERLILIRTGALHAANRELAAEIDRRKYFEDFTNQLSQTLRETSDVVAIGDPEGKLQFLNKAGRVLFGIPEDAPITDLNILFPYSANMRRWITDEVQPELIKNGSWRGETEFQLPDNRTIPISQVMSCKKDNDGNILYFATIARDVSDFKRVELELRQSRERYRTLAEAAHDFIFMVSREGTMEYANEYACRALGHDPQKVEGIPASQFFPREFAINHLQKFVEVHEVDRPVYTEGPFYQDEEQFWLGTWLVPVHDDSGTLVSVLGISRDITEQKKSDEALQRALQNERRLGEFRSNFFSMTSHQFRTPLSTILLSAGLLQKYIDRWDQKEREEHISRILDAARRLNNMLEDILVIGRVEAGRYICIPKDFDLIAFIALVIAELAANDSGGHDFLFKHEPEHYNVFLDQEVLSRVIDNLLSNAIKYSPQGTLVIVELKIEDDHFRLEVTDQGIGIPESDMKYLFQPFQRGSNAADYPGTGIGLTIIQKSVELMNGSISVKSIVGQGTTFTIRFPSRLVRAEKPEAT